MANKKQARRQGALGGAITPALLPTPAAPAPQTFNQFVADRQTAAPRPGGPSGGGGAAANPFTPPPPTATAVADPTPHGTPGRGTLPNGTTPTLPGGATPPNPVGDYDPALYADFVRHWYAMQNAKVRGDDPANYGAGTQRTMAF